MVLDGDSGNRTDDSSPRLPFNSTSGADASAFCQSPSSIVLPSSGVSARAIVPSSQPLHDGSVPSCEATAPQQMATTLLAVAGLTEEPENSLTPTLERMGLLTPQPTALPAPSNQNGQLSLSGLDLPFTQPRADAETMSEAVYAEAISSFPAALAATHIDASLPAVESAAAQHHLDFLLSPSVSISREVSPGVAATDTTGPIASAATTARASRADSGQAQTRQLQSRRQAEPRGLFATSDRPLNEGDGALFHLTPESLVNLAGDDRGADENNMRTLGEMLRGRLDSREPRASMSPQTTVSGPSVHDMPERAELMTWGKAINLFQRLDDDHEDLFIDAMEATGWETLLKTRQKREVADDTVLTQKDATEDEVVTYTDERQWFADIWGRMREDTKAIWSEEGEAAAYARAAACASMKQFEPHFLDIYEPLDPVRAIELICDTVPFPLFATEDDEDDDNNAGGEGGGTPSSDVDGHSDARYMDFA